MKVKICGLRHKKDIEAAVEAGADYIGFVFAKSRRQVSLEEAHDLATVIPTSVKTVGVFVNPSLADVLQAVKDVPLDIVQLHGQESPTFVETLRVPVIKAITLSAGTDLSTVSLYPKNIHFLLDAPGSAYEGGSGHVFDWHTIEPKSLPMERVFIAGGLNIENVHQAVTYFAPYGVDVSSGVETDGQKDVSKIMRFVAEAKGDK